MQAFLLFQMLIDTLIRGLTVKEITLEKITSIAKWGKKSNKSYECLQCQELIWNWIEQPLVPLKSPTMKGILAVWCYHISSFKLPPSKRTLVLWRHYLLPFKLPLSKMNLFRWCHYLLKFFTVCSATAQFLMYSALLKPLVVQSWLRYRELYGYFFWEDIASFFRS